MKISEKVRNQVFARDEYRCVACGTSNALTIQHRVSKGMGGSKQFDTVAYLLAMCNFCNTRLESDAEWAEIGLDSGWKMMRNVKPKQDPTQVPVRYLDGWYVLNQYGGRTKIGETPKIKE